LHALIAPKSKRNIFLTFKLLFDHAIKLELRTDNPVLGIELPRVNQAAPERLSAATCQLLLETAVLI
jgi:site-specific recombinase XerD